MIFFVGLTYAELTAAMPGVVENMYLVIVRWERQVPLSVHGQSF